MARVYLETSVVSYLTSRLSRDTIVLGRQESTRVWWNKERPRHEVVVSQLVVAEASRGDLLEVAKRLETLKHLPTLEVTDEAGLLAERLVASGEIPLQAADDALHLSIAVVHQIE